MMIEGRKGLNRKKRNREKERKKISLSPSGGKPINKEQHWFPDDKREVNEACGWKQMLREDCRMRENFWEDPLLFCENIQLIER